MAALSGTRRSRRKSVVKPRRSSHTTRVHGKKIQRLRSIPQEDVAETKELVKEKGIVPQEKVRKEYKRTPMMPLPQQQEESPVVPEQMMPELDEFDMEKRVYKKREKDWKKTRTRKERIKKNPRKNWKELGLLEKRGLA